MSYEKFLDDINNGGLQRVYLCYGKEYYLRDWIIEQLKKIYIDESFETLNLTYFDGKETSVDDIINACETLPFMSQKKIVIVKDSPLIILGKSGNGNEEGKLNEYIPTLAGSTCLVFIATDESIDKRRKLIKTINKIGSIVELNKLKENELNKWIEKIFRKNRKKISKRDVLTFTQAIGYLEYNNDKTLYDVENEIVKLCNYVGVREFVTKEDIERNTAKSLHNNIFELLDAVGKKNTSIALLVLNEMILDNEPIQKIMFMIIKQIRLLFKTKLMLDKGYTQMNIAPKLGVHPYAAKKVIEQSRNFSNEELENVFKKCLSLDEDVKKGKIDNKLALETFIVEFSQKKK